MATRRFILSVHLLPNIAGMPMNHCPGRVIRNQTRRITYLAKITHIPQG